MRSLAIEAIGPLPTFLQHVTEDVAPITAPTGDGMWLVSSYSLGRLVLTDQRFSRSAAAGSNVPRFNDAQPVTQSIMSMDGVAHARSRRMIAAKFSSRQVAEMVPFIEHLTDGYLDRMVERGSPADLIEEFATPLSLAVLCRVLGVPDEDTEKFRDQVSVLFDISASSLEQKARRRIELVRYMAYLIDYKRQHPGNDLLTTLIGVHDQGELSKSGLITMGLTLLMAGFETTTSQIGLTVKSLLSDSDIYRTLLTQPAVLQFAVEEWLRLTPSTPMTFTRVANECVPLGHVNLEPGEAVVVSLLHANRDASVFAEPDKLLLDRVPPHLTFGYGNHRCPGAQLARTQILIILGRLLQRFPTFRLADCPDPVSWKHGLATRGLSRLMVTW